MGAVGLTAAEKVAFVQVGITMNRYHVCKRILEETERIGNSLGRHRVDMPKE